MKKTLIKIAVVFVVFIMTMLIASNIINLESTDMTSDMAAPTLPVLKVIYDDVVINSMHGYYDDMELSYMRGCITPLNDNRSIRLSFDLYGNHIERIDYEVRTLDGERLIENNSVDSLEQNGNNATTEIILKDLLEKDKEYELIVKALTSGGKDLKYYTRIIKSDDYNIPEKLEFVSSFSERTFDKVEAENLTQYLEPNSEGDNTNFGRVDIHSSFDQVTWGDLEVAKVTDPVITIKELSEQTGSFLVDYYVSTPSLSGDISYYKVREYLRIRRGRERMYLLDYERTMDEVFPDDKTSFFDNGIMLGINSGNIRMSECEDGSNVAFTSGGRLYSFSTTGNSMAFLFGFYDSYNSDQRTMYDEHAIKIMDVDEAGNVMFIVYGYMNRGLHEGSSCVAAYYYDASVNSVEELLCIPSTHSPDLLMKEVEELSYMNSNGELFLLIGDTLYGIDSKAHEATIVAGDLTEGRYEVAYNNRLIAYQKGDGIYDSSELIMHNLDSGRQNTISAGYGETIIPIAFIGEDLIYGVAKKSDLTKDRSGALIAPMYEVVIYNEFEGELMKYDQQDMYVVSGRVNDNQIILNRMQKEEDGSFIEAPDDQIMNSEDVSSTRNKIDTVAVEIYEKLTQIIFKSDIDSKSVKHLNPKHVLFEGDRSITIDDIHEGGGYVVYGRYGVDSVFKDECNAVNRAYEISGVAMDNKGTYIYRKTSRSTKNQIMAITEDASTPERGSLAVCLDTMLQYEGYVRNSQYMLDTGESVMDILEDAFTDYEVLDLTGCNQDVVLYYVNMDIPVLGMLDDGSAVLLIGFNEEEVVLMDPNEGSIYKKDIEESMDMFNKNGNTFITYIKDI